MRSIYLDANATTPLHSRVRDAMVSVLREDLGNPSSIHGFGRRARAVIEGARESVATLIGATPDEIFFTSGGTESNQLFIGGCPEAESALYVGPYEHPSVREPAMREWREGRGGRELGCATDGGASTAAVATDAWCSIQWVNNETGAVEDLRSHARAIHDLGGVLHTDGAQGFFRLRSRVDELDVDAATVTAHKSFGPVGVGAIYLRRGCILEPRSVGGPQERGLRPGTENVAAIHGMGELARLAMDEELWPRDALLERRSRFLDALHDIPGLHVITPLDRAFPNVVMVAVEDLDADTILFRLDRVGVAASSGSACSAGLGKPSTVLRAMGLADELIRGALRFSFTAHTAIEDLVTAATKVRRELNELRRQRSETEQDTP